MSMMKVKGYWPGKAPEFAANDDNDECGDIRIAALEKAFPSHEGADVIAKDDDDPDPRLCRLARSRIDHELDEDHRRRFVQAEIALTVEGESTDAEEAEEVAERRRRIREKILQKQQEEEEATLLPAEEEEEDERYEYETVSKEEEETITSIVAMVKPVFVPKPERYTIAGRERLDAEERALEEVKKKRMEVSQKETRRIVFEKIKKDMELRGSKNLDTNIADVDTHDDDVNKEEEYEAWKAREIARIGSTCGLYLRSDKY